MNNIIFTEKYRPKNIDDLIIDKYLYNKLNNIINLKYIPNLIITGPSGTGKTSTILTLINNIYKNNKDYILELNASTNRTLEYINSTVSFFCQKKMNSDLDLNKIIYLDEADNITKKAQNLLINIMDEFKDTTSFLFTCNDSSGIIEGIQSRCIILKYNTIRTKDIIKKLLYICVKENISYTLDGLKALEKISQGDLRKSINNLEIIYNTYNEITVDNVYNLCYEPNPQFIASLIQFCVDQNLKKSLKIINDLKNIGYSSTDIISSLITCLRYINIDENIRINYLKIISETLLIISDGIETELQLYACIIRMIKYIDIYNLIEPIKS